MSTRLGLIRVKVNHNLFSLELFFPKDKLLFENVNSEK